jgi:hypothetical protein
MNAIGPRTSKDNHPNERESVPANNRTGAGETRPPGYECTLPLIQPGGGALAWAGQTLAILFFLGANHSRGYSRCVVE